jgi:hypothetical protein
MLADKEKEARSLVIDVNHLSLSKKEEMVVSKVVYTKDAKPIGKITT